MIEALLIATLLVLVEGFAQAQEGEDSGVAEQTPVESGAEAASSETTGGQTEQDDADETTAVLEVEPALASSEAGQDATTDEDRVAEIRDRLRRATTLRVVGLVLFGVGGATTVAGLATVIESGGDDQTRQTIGGVVAGIGALLLLPGLIMGIVGTSRRRRAQRQLEFESTYRGPSLSFEPSVPSIF